MEDNFTIDILATSIAIQALGAHTHTHAHTGTGTQYIRSESWVLSVTSARLSPGWVKAQLQ